jgi:cation transport ATPase
MTLTRIIDRLTALFALIFAIVPAAIVLSQKNRSPLPFELVIMALCSSPYVVLALAAHYGRYPCVKVGSFIVLMLSGIFCTYIYADYFFAPATQRGHVGELYVFLLYPIDQLFVSAMSVGLLFAIGAWLERRKEQQGGGASASRLSAKP